MTASVRFEEAEQGVTREIHANIVQLKMQVDQGLL